MKISTYPRGEAEGVWRLISSGRLSFSRMLRHGGFNICIAEELCPDTARPLSKRQVAVALGVARGEANKVLASDLGVSTSTIAGDIAALLERLLLADRLQLIRLVWALTGASLEPGPPESATGERRAPLEAERRNPMADEGADSMALERFFRHRLDEAVWLWRNPMFAEAVIGVRTGESLELPTLSDAEREIGGLLLEGFSSEEIANQRGSSRRTVENQIGGLYRKLGVQSRTELVAHACRHACRMKGRACT